MTNLVVEAFKLLLETLDVLQVVALLVLVLLSLVKLAVLFLDSRQWETLNVTGAVRLGQRVSTAATCRSLRLNRLRFDVDLYEGVRIWFTVAKFEPILLRLCFIGILAQVEIRFTKQPWSILCEYSQNTLLLRKFASHIIPVNSCFHLKLFIKNGHGALWAEPLDLRIYCFSSLLP